MKILPLLGAVFTICAVFFACAFYFFQGQLDENIAFTAFYYDDQAIKLYNVNASQDAVLLASNSAYRWCALYGFERRQIVQNYADMCSEIMNRSLALAACVKTDFCKYSGEIRPSWRSRSDWWNRVYVGLAFAPRLNKCFLGREAVPCPF